MKRKIILSLVPIVFIGTFLIYPLVLLFLRFPNGDLHQILLKNAAIIKFTIFQALISAFLTMLLGIPGAYLIARTRLPKTVKSLLKSASMVPFVLPGISMAIGFLLTFGNNGIVNSVLSFFNLRIRILYTFTAVLIGHVFYNFPLFIRIVGDAFERIDKSLLEMANLEGASKFKRFWHVELPLMTPAIGSAFALSYLYCFTSFAVVMILGGIKYSTIEVSIYMYLRVLLDFESALF
ncbi:MAG TPA: ABC transporter permease subunit, partial [Pseudothermotoga sp.]